MKHYDAIIIGAGAAGLMCALTASKRGRKVLLIDAAKKVGEKIRISGGGRCNFTNLHTSPKNFISQNPHFCVSALQRFTPQDFIAMIKKHEIVFHEKTLGQLFCDFSSQQIIDMLLTECREGGVEILLETLAKNIKNTQCKIASKSLFVNDCKNYVEETNFNECAAQPLFASNCKDSNITKNSAQKIFQQNFTLELKNKNNEETLPQKVSCQSLIIATGGLSIPKMGATSFGFDIARKFGLKIVEPFPALVPLTLEPSMLAATKNLAGVAVEAIVSCKKISENSTKYLENSTENNSAKILEKLKNKGSKAATKNQNIQFRESILFTHRGLSGPAILQISSYLQQGQELLINMAPNHNIYDIFLYEKQHKAKQEIITILNKYLPKSLASYILQTHATQGLNDYKNNLVTDFIADISNQKLKEIANHINAWSLIPQGNEGYAKAEVTAGGVDTNEISSKTFECKHVSGLYFIGEVLDVTGHLGGFNFQWAWSSGHAAGQFA